MRRVAVLTVGMLLLSASLARAEFYRWVDKDGKEFFTNEREAVPKEYQSTATAVNPDERRVSIGDKPAATGKPAIAGKDHKDKNGKGEEYWRKRAGKLRKELAALQGKYDLALKQEEKIDNKPQKLTSNGTTKKSRNSLEKKRSKLEKDLARKKHELEVELPDEARKADAYPGWIRE